MCIILLYFNIILNLGIEYISPDINIPQIPLLTNKSIVTIYAFISLNDISVSVVYNQLEMSRFLNDFSVFCMTCMYQPIRLFILIKYFYFIKEK